ncbi:hypothetical protein KCU38_004461 [Vibrio vulnificus]|nr:hypothetical protein [Vibrio vulnificus]
MAVKTLVILAKSIKHQAYCVAGKCLATGQWVRPVSSASGGAISAQQSQVTNPYGTYSLNVLQNVEIDFSSHSPLINQPENYLISNKAWLQRFNTSLSALGQYLDTPASLWGQSDRVSYMLIRLGMVPVPQSLYLVKVTNLNLYFNNFNKRRASFTYNSINYDLAVTDPNFSVLIDAKLQSILCISLGENHQGSCFKLVASIF